MPYVKLAGLLILLHGTLGSVMFAVTTFLFDFSGSQYRMGPVVTDGFLVVGALVLALGIATLAKTQSLSSAVRFMLLSFVVAWSIAVFVEWRVSFQLGGN
ncbi:MAG: hypothetical protein JWO59_1499 [Chloroflexi bacterium]|nr:hypothetical protein [Chloroflexota bacterium]